VLAIDDEPGGGPVDFHPVMARHHGAEFYCCGPQAMLTAFAAASAGLGITRVHTEHFAGVEVLPGGNGFDVVLARSNRRISIAPGQTILAAIRAAGIDIASSCEEGICGVCETRVLAGAPHHRDLVLTPSEQACNTTMMICCSGSKSAELVLDL
jgi:tetrachlorobenzoquinone reductase